MGAHPRKGASKHATNHTQVKLRPSFHSAYYVLHMYILYTAE